MQYRAAIFDIDGTLVDSVDLHTEAWRRVFVDYGKDIPFQDIRRQIGKGGDQLLPEFMSQVKPFPDVRSLFERLKRDGYKIALASSAKKDELEHYARLLEIEDLIHAGTSTDDAEKSKPHPDIFEAAMKKLGGGVPNALTVAIGDTPYDAEAAGKIRIPTIGVLCGGFPEADLRRAGAIAIFKDPEELLRRYDESPFAEQSR